MDDAVLAEEDEGLKHLNGEAPDQGCRKAGKAIGLDELVEIDAEELRCNAEVIAEVEVLGHNDDTMLLVGVLVGAKRGIRVASISQCAASMRAIQGGSRTHFRRLSRILTSTSA